MTRHAGDEKRMQSLMVERDEIAKQLEAAEREAGIWEKADKARQGPLIPYGVFDERPSGAKQQALENDLYWADQHDDIRGKIRALYFAVSGVESRKALISLDAELESANRRILAQGVVDARLELAAMKHKQANPPWVAAGVISCIAVLIGSLLAGIAGAIGGAILGYFWGQGMVSHARTDAQAATEVAESFLRDAEAAYRERAESGWRPAYFSNSERRSGVEDEDFGRLSATEQRLALDRE